MRPGSLKQQVWFVETTSLFCCNKKFFPSRHTDFKLKFVSTSGLVKETADFVNENKVGPEQQRVDMTEVRRDWRQRARGWLKRAGRSQAWRKRKKHRVKSLILP